MLFVFSVLCVAQSLGNDTVLMSRHEEILCFTEPALYIALLFKNPHIGEKKPSNTVSANSRVNPEIHKTSKMNYPTYLLILT